MIEPSSMSCPESRHQIHVSSPHIESRHRTPLPMFHVTYHYTSHSSHVNDMIGHHMTRCPVYLVLPNMTRVTSRRALRCTTHVTSHALPHTTHADVMSRFTRISPAPRAWNRRKASPNWVPPPILSRRRSPTSRSIDSIDSCGSGT